MPRAQGCAGAAGLKKSWTDFFNILLAFAHLALNLGETGLE